MRNSWKKCLTVAAAVAFITAGCVIIPHGNSYEVEAASTVTEINSFSDLQIAIDNCNKGNEVSVKLNAEITGVTSSLQLSDGELSLDLNGHTLSGSMKGAMITSSGSSKLTITDSSEQKGCVKNEDTGGGVIEKTGGTLTISGGTFTGGRYCIMSSNSTITITGGSYAATNETDGYAMRISSGELLISGTPEFTSHYVTIGVPSDATNTKVEIQGGTFTASKATDFCYVCGFEGKDSSLKISGGTFQLNANSGSSLVIGGNVLDSDVEITGGTYDGRIARFTTGSSRLNDTAFYGDRNGEGGILPNGYVLTDNAFSYENNNTVFSPEKVSVVQGSLVRFDTRRSAIEAYTDSEMTAADNADYSSVSPVSVGVDKKVYSNSDGKIAPSSDSGRWTNGTTYEFVSWWDEERQAEYSSVNDYLTSQTWLSPEIILHAVWKAKATTSAGFEDAVKNDNAVKEIQLTNSITMTSFISCGADTSSGQMQRTIDFGGNTVEYAVSSSSPAFVLNGAWNLKNGTIESSHQACLEIEGTAVIENLNCKAKDFTYAVGFRNVTSSSANRIISGTFEASAADGHALWVTSASGAATSEDITRLFQTSNASCKDTKVDGTNVYLNARKLLVTQNMITYIESVPDVDLGSSIYGETNAGISQTINNQEFVGDIVITGVSVDNTAFVTTGENTEKTLTGGSTDTYTYTIKPTEKLTPGTYTGTVSIHYTKLDQTTGVCRQKVSLVVQAKQLTITEPVLTKTKSYDGKKTAAVTAGALSGVVSGDEVSVSATAAYSSATAGTKKTIAVSYTLAGADKDKYLVPAAVTYTDGVINKAAGKATISMADYHVGEKAKVKISSSTNGTKSVKFYFKQKGAKDSTYTTSVPGKEGSYTIKAVFAATTNYKEVEVTANFKVTYIDTPKQPYTLKGTKGKNDWYKSSVVVIPAKGYTISTKQSGTYGSSYTIDSTTTCEVYLKDSNGAVTKAINVGKIQIDKTLPTISGISNGGTYYDDNLKVVVSDSNLSSVTLNGKNVSVSGTSTTISLSPSETKYTVVAEDKAGNKVTYTAKVEEAWMKEGVVSDGKKKLIKKKSYKLGSGQWKVSGDNTVYSGNMNFYVSSDGEYDFKKQ